MFWLALCRQALLSEGGIMVNRNTSYLCYKKEEVGLKLWLQGNKTKAKKAKHMKFISVCKCTSEAELLGMLHFTA